MTRENKPYYPFLEAAIAQKGIFKKELSKALGVSQKSLNLKLNGKVDWWWHEVTTLRTLFPEIPIDQLFSHETM